MNTKRLMVTLCASMALSGRAFGNTDMDDMLRALDQDKPEQYEAVMTSFIDSARAGDVDKMVFLTSTLTTKKMGLEALKKHYVQDTVPALRACVEISRGVNAVHLDKGPGGSDSGWAYRKTCVTEKNKSIPLEFVILNEGGHIALASFGLARWGRE